MIAISSGSDSDSNSGDSGVKSTGKKRSLAEIAMSDDNNSNKNKRAKIEIDCFSVDDNDDNNSELGQNNNSNNNNDLSVVLPVGFLDPLSPLDTEFNNYDDNNYRKALSVLNKGCRQFWKAGDYEGDAVDDRALNTSCTAVGMDHARVHPKFLHSNATSHKWALGAFAELLDNALDEVCNGATYVNVDMLMNMKRGHKMKLAEKDRYRMLLVQDNGGGMKPDKMRACMSLGYSAKSKMANTIGQYGNGFKTSTMRLGADAIVFSCCKGKNGASPTRSIGMLSFTFLMKTGKEDIVVPMIDYEKKGNVWTKMLRTSIDDWHLNLDTITDWSPYSSDQELLQQFDFLDDQGTRIIIYNLWEDDMNTLELDFDTDPQDIQIRGVNRDEKKIDMARNYPNSRHFLTYQHSLRYGRRILEKDVNSLGQREYLTCYASILYLRLPPGFRIILRGKDVVHHNLEDDMAQKKHVQYRPAPITNGIIKDPKPSEAIQVFVTMGFVKDAKHHIDIQGFNVYHKNRLIKPFWRVWNAAGSDGRGVIGLLEADFVEPAHDKQGFEKTTALSRLEARLRELQKAYWRDNCHEIGYAPRRAANKKGPVSAFPLSVNVNFSKGLPFLSTSENSSLENLKKPMRSVKRQNPRSLYADSSSGDDSDPKTPPLGNQSHSSTKLSGPEGYGSLHTPPSEKSIGKSGNLNASGNRHRIQHLNADLDVVANLRKENLKLKKKRLQEAKDLSRGDYLQQQLQLEKDRCKSLKAQLEEANKEQESLIEIFAEEREQRNAEGEKMRKRLQDASTTIDGLMEKVKMLENMKLPKFKTEENN